MDQHTQIKREGMEPFSIGLLRGIVRDLAEEMERLKQRQHALQGEFRVISRVLDATTTAKNSLSHCEAPCDSDVVFLEPTHVAPATNLLRPTEAVLTALREREGRTPTELADSMLDRVKSTAKDRRNVLRTTAAKLVNEGVLRKDDRNRLYLNEEEESPEEMALMR